MLKIMTMTGADNEVSPNALIELSEEFPFLEWGVLVGDPDRKPKPRLPGRDWIASLGELAWPEARLSLHLCPPWVRYFYAGRPDRLNDLRAFGVYVGPGWYTRVQLNSAGMTFRLGFHPCQMAEWLEDVGVELIQQLDGVNDHLLGIPGTYRHITGLFDRSHGGGVIPDRWPVPPIPGAWIGYAGGLGPENLAEQLPLIAAAAGGADFWVDMETHVRTDGKLDLAKVRACAEIARDYMGAES